MECVDDDYLIDYHLSSDKSEVFCGISRDVQRDTGGLQGSYGEIPDDAVEEMNADEENLIELTTKKNRKAVG